MEGDTVNVTFESGASSAMTIQQMLVRYIGQYIICELLIGLRAMTVRDGILIEVGRDYFVLQDRETGNMTGCDLYSLKFVTVPMNPGASSAGQHGHGGYTHVPAGEAGTQFGTPAYRPHAEQPQHGKSGAPWPSASWMRVD